MRAELGVWKVAASRKKGRKLTILADIIWVQALNVGLSSKSGVDEKL